MPWTAPRTWLVNEVVTAGMMNAHVRDNLNAVNPDPATTLPSPSHGLVALLVDSTTNPSYQWRFRYNANSTSPYKWEFVGGTPIVVASSSTTLPAHGGDYLVEGTGWANTDGGTTTGNNVGINLTVGGVTVAHWEGNSPPGSGGAVGNASSGHYGIGLRGRANAAASGATVAHGLGSNPTVLILPYRIS
jgi:hypothetical protein